MLAGDKVLYVGVGPGEDAVLAARHGAQVTCIDLSAQMLTQAEGRMRSQGCTAEFLQQDVLEHDRHNHYDVVVVNFFLNVFSESQMRDMLACLVKLVRPTGKLLISDFATPRGNPLARSLQAVYWGITDLFYYLLGLCAWHPIYDYASYFPAVGLELRGEKRFRPYGIGPGGFAALTAVRQAA
jgi:2-polyprenyl-3-methyl-5-hydroxy-6-metoxy-1,4-benzoquinol methylase